MKVDRKVSLVMYFCYVVMFPFDWLAVFGFRAQLLLVVSRLWKTKCDGDVWRAIVDEQVETLNPT